MMQKSNSDALPYFHLLIVAAGQGLRMGETELPKQYLNLSGKPVLRHSLERFMNCKTLLSITVVIHQDHQNYFSHAVSGLQDIKFVLGGVSRNESVYNGLRSMALEDDDLVLIHDAARALIEPKNIYDLLRGLSVHRAATLGVPVSDTLCKTDGQAIDRDGLWAVQTPQGFRFGDIVRAHETWDKNKAATDDASMVRALGIDVGLIEGSKTNIKLTVAKDLEFMKNILSETRETRTGMGFDVHAFELENVDRKLILCGIDVPHDYGLKGHSDADVGLHTITDALLGAIGAGDIGQHFPPSDGSFKDMDSSIFLKKAHEMLLEKGGEISNIDLTIICEAPKIGPYRKQMEDRIAEILNLEESRINVKATTTEKLGFTGRKEGIAAQAVVSVKV